MSPSRAQSASRGVFACRDRGDDELGVRRGREVLERVDDDVALAREQRVAQRTREEARAAGAGERLVRAVAVGGDGDELGRHAGRVGEVVGDHAGLGEREGAAARADAQRASGRCAHASTSAISSSPMRRPV